MFMTAVTQTFRAIAWKERHTSTRQRVTPFWDLTTSASDALPMKSSTPSRWRHWIIFIWSTATHAVTRIRSYLNLKSMLICKYWKVKNYCNYLAVLKLRVAKLQKTLSTEAKLFLWHFPNNYHIILSNNSISNVTSLLLRVAWYEKIVLWVTI